MARKDQNSIVASFEVPPEHPELRLAIDEQGAVHSVRLDRWGNVGQHGYGYVPFGADIHAEQRFGGYTIPSQVTVGCWYGSPRFQPFFEATITRHEFRP